MDVAEYKSEKWGMTISPWLEWGVEEYLLRLMLWHHQLKQNDHQHLRRNGNVNMRGTRSM